MTAPDSYTEKQTEIYNSLLEKIESFDTEIDSYLETFGTKEQKCIMKVVVMLTTIEFLEPLLSEEVEHPFDNIYSAFWYVCRGLLKDSFVDCIKICNQETAKECLRIFDKFDPLFNTERISELLV